MDTITDTKRIVASYTTLPGRYEILHRSILSLTNQTRRPDVVYLCVPLKATQFDKEYPPLPTELEELCTVVRINTDYGPITKVCGALLSETDPNTVIISCDDDVIFPPNFIQSMLEHHEKFPNSAICGTGALLSRGLIFISIMSSLAPFRPWNGFIAPNVPPEGRKVDLIFGVAGVLYRRGFFPPPEQLYDEILCHSMNDHAIFCNDDVLISGYLSRKGIERRIFADIPDVDHDNTIASVAETALCKDTHKMIMRLHEAIDKVKQLGFFPTMEDVSVDETAAGKGFILFFLLTIILVLSFYYYILIR